MLYLHCVGVDHVIALGPTLFIATALSGACRALAHVHATGRSADQKRTYCLTRLQFSIALQKGSKL
jgi:hypothetical protein